MSPGGSLNRLPLRLGDTGRMHTRGHGARKKPVTPFPHPAHVYGTHSTIVGKTNILPLWSFCLVVQTLNDK